jgi:hypothetical protein
MLGIKKSLIFTQKVQSKEQLIRLAQYFSFLMQALLKYTKYSKATKKFQKLSGNLSIVRKVLRFGMPLVVLSNISSELREKRINLFKIASHFLSLIFYLSDHLLYFYRVRLVTLEKNSKYMQIVDVIRSLAWVSFLIAKITDYTVDIHRVQKKIQKIKNYDGNYRNTDASEKFNKLLSQSDMLVLGITARTFELPVALYFLDPGKINPVIVGVLGCLSSVVQIYKILKREKK